MPLPDYKGPFSVASEREATEAVPQPTAGVAGSWIFAR